MKNSFGQLTESLGIEYPIFAFSHCRDVVVEVSKAGGLGVLGAGFFSHEELKRELDWIDTHIGGRPYGVDVVIPQAYEGRDEGLTANELEEKLWSMIPPKHLKFTEKLLQDHGVPKWEDDSRPGLFGWTLETALPCVEEALTHPGCKLIANALGTPPADVIKKVKSSGRLVGALCGNKKQALAHKAAGLDFIVAQGGEGGGHTGEIGSIVLWPEIVDAVSPLPVLAAGGVASGRQMLAAMSLGAAGIWTGSLWLTVEEANAQPAQKESFLRAASGDTVRSRAWTGKSARVLRNAWTEAWDAEDTLPTLKLPLHALLAADAIRRTERCAREAGTQDVAMNICGQVIGQINEVESCRGVILRLLSEYVDALEQINAAMPEVEA
ncbi:MAG: nitronate monooxygenase [bacterium]|nr:nitronate monooxygenase [bacterium]